ncbi:MAG: ABC transporter ATP-binding protein [Deltaproteobacteria bacterium]|nr:ABC transporter ATP-binding protein [Deltaproteobacteria bacterium]
MIELVSVSVRRGPALMLDRLTLSLGAEVVALVGPSGSGKTTLLRVLLGLEPPSAGQVSIAGRVVSHDGRVDVPPEERNVAMVFQDLALWPHLTVHGNLAYGLSARGIGKTERDRRVAQALSWVGLDGKAPRSPQELSGGERQRVAIARALVLDPVALLLDEPMGSLDVALKSELLDLFARLFREREIPIVYVTHDPREARRIARRIIVLEGGRVVQHGSLDELVLAPATPFVGAFVRAARGADA